MSSSLFQVSTSSPSLPASFYTSRISPIASIANCYRKRDTCMMEAPKEEKKFSCKVCENSFPSYQHLSGHIGCHYSGHLKRKKKPTHGNEEPEDLTPESKAKDIALARPLIVLNEKPDWCEKESLKIDIPESGAEEVGPKSLCLETWLKDREKIQVTDPDSEEKEQIEQASKPESETDVSLTVPVHRTLNQRQLICSPFQL